MGPEPWSSGNCRDSNTAVRIFTTQCTIVQSVVLQLHVIRLSVCDVGGSGSHRLEILET